MRHNFRAAGRYVEAFSWHQDIDDFVRRQVVERPILHVCAGPVSSFGDVRVDRYVSPISPAIIADWRALPFRDDSFGCVFADPPWNIGHMKDCADFCKSALYIAPVLYVMSPWLWVEKNVRRAAIWVREFPGICAPILLVRYERKNTRQMSLWS